MPGLLFKAETERGGEREREREGGRERERARERERERARERERGRLASWLRLGFRDRFVEAASVLWRSLV